MAASSCSVRQRLFQMWQLVAMLLIASCAMQLLVMERSLTSCNKGSLDLTHMLQGGIHNSRSAILDAEQQHPCEYRSRVPASRDFRLDTLAPGMFNPTFAVYNEQAWILVRSQSLLSNKKWALGRNHLARLNLTDWSVSSFHDFDPWAASSMDLPCKAKDSGSQVDVWGADDTKLLVWPGNGLWAVTAGRPRTAATGQPHCSCGRLQFQLFLVQLAREGQAFDPANFAQATEHVPPENFPGWVSAEDTVACLEAGMGSANFSSWDMLWGAKPMPLTVEDAETVYGNKKVVEEKNWGFFQHGEQLYVSYQLAPKHRVYSLGPDGRAKLQHETTSKEVFQPLGRPYESLNGGPSFVPMHTSIRQGNKLESQPTDENDYLLGVMHYHTKVVYEDDPTYHHHLIKIEAQPPFRIFQLSAELRLRSGVGAPNKHNVAFVSGMQLVLLHPRAPAGVQHNGPGDEKLEPQPHIVISYGVADYFSHIMVLSMAEVDDLFESAPWHNVDLAGTVATAHTGNAKAMVLSKDTAGLHSAIANYKAGAVIVYWHLQQCGGTAMCESLHKAKSRMLSCWSLIPSSGPLKERQRGCTCSGPKQLGISYLNGNEMADFAARYDWMKVIFSNNGMPAKPYFGKKAVQVAVLCDPITRFLRHAQQEGDKYNIQDFKQPNMTATSLSTVVLQHASNLKLLVPDNYMTRFFAGRAALEDYDLLSTSATQSMYEAAIKNLNQVDMVLVLEESMSNEVSWLLETFGLRAFDKPSLNRPPAGVVPDTSVLPPELVGQLASLHYHDMNLYRYACARQARLMTAFMHLKQQQPTHM